MRFAFCLLVMARLCLASIYDSLDSLPEARIDSTPPPEQIDLIRRESKDNPAATDRIYYKQKAIQEEIQRDPTLRIDPSREGALEDFGESEWYDFSISYVLKLVNETPHGEAYKIAIPMVPKRGATTAKECEIQTSKNYYSLMRYPHYTEAQTRHSLKKQTQILLYKLLEEYKGEVLLCLMQHSAHIDDRSMTINLESRTKTLAKVKAYLLANFNGGILTLRILDLGE